MLGLEELSADDQRIVQHARRLIRFLTQPFFVTEAFTGKEGRLVSVEETLDGCEAILDGEFDDVPESVLYMIGNIEEARAHRAADTGATHGGPGSVRAADDTPARPPDSSGAGGEVVPPTSVLSGSRRSHGDTEKTKRRSGQT